MGIAPNLIGGRAAVFSHRDLHFIRAPTTEGSGVVNRQNDRLAVVGGTVINEHDVKINICPRLRPRRYREGRGSV